MPIFYSKMELMIQRIKRFNFILPIVRNSTFSLSYTFVPLRLI